MADEYKCPCCGGELERVRMPGWMGEGQAASMRPGDWFCRSCPEDKGTAGRARSGFAYFHDADLARDEPVADHMRAKATEMADAWDRLVVDAIASGLPTAKITLTADLGGRSMTIREAAVSCVGDVIRYTEGGRGIVLSADAVASLLRAAQRRHG